LHIEHRLTLQVLPLRKHQVENNTSYGVITRKRVFFRKVSELSNTIIPALPPGIAQLLLVLGKAVELFKNREDLFDINEISG
jgi:hypothetical protein